MKPELYAVYAALLEKYSPMLTGFEEYDGKTFIKTQYAMFVVKMDMGRLLSNFDRYVFGEMAWSNPQTQWVFSTLQGLLGVKK